MPIAHASLCAAACVALREPGFALLDIEASDGRGAPLPGVTYVGETPEERSELIAQFEDPFFLSIMGGLLTASFTVRDMLEGIPQLGTQIPLLHAAIANQEEGEATEDFE